MGRKGLLSKLNALTEPAPSRADPEDYDGWDGTSAASLSANRDNSDDEDSDEAELARNYLPSKLRADADMASEEWGDKYGSKKVSRKKLQESSDKEIDDDEDEEDDDEDEEEDDEEEDDEDEDDDRDDDDENSEFDEDEFDDEDEPIDYKLKRKRGPQNEQTSAFVALGVEKELEELDQTDKTSTVNTKGSTMSQQERAVRAKALVADFDTMLEVRIALQQVMAVASKLPSEATDKSAMDRQTASHHLQRVIQRLCSLREDLRCSHGSNLGGRSSHVVDNIAKKDRPKNNEDDNEKEEEEQKVEETDVLLGDEVNLSTKKRKLLDDKEEGGRDEKLNMVWDAIDDGFSRSRPFWENTLEIWQRRAQIGGAAVSKHKFKIVNRNVFDQSTAALQDRTRAMKKAHPLIVKKQREEEKDGQEEEEEKTETPSYDTSVFEDTSFYHSLLKDFLESRNNSTEHTEMVMAAAAKRRRTKHNGIDTRATKGRKIRYELLPKLENFMFPSNELAPPLNVDELFNSLFGKNNS